MSYLSLRPFKCQLTVHIQFSLWLLLAPQLLSQLLAYVGAQVVHHAG